MKHQAITNAVKITSTVPRAECRADECAPHARSVSGLPEQHHGQEDFENHVRGQPNLAHLVHGVNGDERQHSPMKMSIMAGVIRILWARILPRRIASDRAIMTSSTGDVSLECVLEIEEE